MSISEQKLQLPSGAPEMGSTFASKYRIDRILGVGGMGYVLAATHVQLDERVAIKLLLPELANNQDTVARFLREGRAAVKIRSEHVGKVLDVGATEAGVPFIVMEYLDGCDLQQLLEKEGHLPLSQAVDYVLQASEAIAEAHAMKTIHRDLKPANLFVVRRPNGTDCVKVLDFGISKMNAPETGGMAMTKTSAIMGSPLYMSPEQLKSARDVTERADIWAIGIILYELIAGEPPFVAENMAELGALVLGGSAPSLRDAVPECPTGLADVVATCLRRNAADRFTSLADFADAVAPFGSPAARGSATRIIGTLGMPPARAHIGVSTPDLAQHASGAALNASSSGAFGPISARASTGGPWGTPSGSSQPTKRSGAFAVLGGVVLIGVVATAGVLGTRYLKTHDANATPSASVAADVATPSASVSAMVTPAASSLPDIASASAVVASAAASVSAAVPSAHASASHVHHGHSSTQTSTPSATASSSKTDKPPNGFSGNRFE